MDLIFNLFTGYSERGLIVTDFSISIKHYLKYNFVFDIIAVLPVIIYNWKTYENPALSIEGRENDIEHI